MSDDPEEVLEDRLEQIQRRAENFRELLKNGEEVTIAFFDDEVMVAESFRSQLERKYPKLFGRLMSLEAQLTPGWVPYFVGLLLVGTLYIGFQLHWWDDVLGEELATLLNNWWFYIVLPGSTVYLISLACGQWQKYIYRRHRRELLDLIAREHLDRDVLLVMLRDLDELDLVTQELKLDPGPFPNPG